jgi:hypothetical protein
MMAAVRRRPSEPPTANGWNMAAKIVSRKEKRAEVEAAEKKTKAAPKKAATTKAAKKEPAKRKSRAKSAKEVRLKAFWGVFNQSLKRIALYEFSEKKEADKKAKELTASGKSPHFVQPVKEEITIKE